MPLGNRYRRFRLNAVEEDGRITAEITVPQGSAWLIERLSTRVQGSATVPELRIYIGAEAAENIVETTDAGDLDIADASSPIYVGAGETLLFIWRNVEEDVGARANVRAQYRVEGYGERRSRQSYPMRHEDIRDGSDVPFNGHKVTAGFGNDGF